MERNRGAKEVDLGAGNVGKLLFQLALPAIIARIINVLYNAVDCMYIDHLPGEGASAFTGVGATFSVTMAISTFIVLVSMGGAPRVFIMLGKGGKDEAEGILGSCTTTPTTVAVVLTVFFPIFGRRILLMFRASGSTIEYGWTYMQIYFLGTTLVQLVLGLNVFIDIQGYARTGIYTVLIGAICNIILDPIPMFAFHMGVWGAALTTIISQGISAAWVVLFLTSNKSYLKIRTCFMQPKREILMPAIALGAAPFIIQFTENILNICFNASLLKYGGDVVVGAMTVMGSVMQLSPLSLQGLTQGIQPIISFNYGAKKLGRVSRTFRLPPTLRMTYSTVFQAVATFVPMVYTRIFTQDVTLTTFSEWSICTYMAASLLFGAQLTCQQTFTVIGDSKTSPFPALLRKVILLMPLIYALPNLFENKVFAVFVVEPIADTIAVCTTVTLFLLPSRKMKRELGANA